MGFSTIDKIVSSREERGIGDLVAAGEWYKAALGYSNCATCKMRFQHLPWGKVSGYGIGFAAGAALVYMGHEQQSLLCTGHKGADCDTSRFVNGGSLICTAALMRLFYSVYTVPSDYGFCKRKGLAERVTDVGMQQYYYIMSAICAEQSAYSFACLSNDNFTQRLDLSDSVSCFRWKEACAHDGNVLLS